MSEAVNAYHSVTTLAEFREAERLRIKASHDEAQALGNAERRGERRANAKWKGIAKENEELRAQLAELKAKHGE